MGWLAARPSPTRGTCGQVSAPGRACLRASLPTFLASPESERVAGRQGIEVAALLGVTPAG